MELKKCTQCGQDLSDDVRFCFRCGGSQFTPAADAAAQGPASQPPYQPLYQPAVYQRTVNNEPATIGDYLLFALFMIIPVFNLVYLIVVAVGGPKYKKSMTNYARATLILMAISLALLLVFLIIGAFTMRRYTPYSYPF